MWGWFGLYMRSEYCAPTYLDKCTNSSALLFINKGVSAHARDWRQVQELQLVSIAALLPGCRGAVVVQNSGVIA